MIEAWFDGACEPVNPGGKATYGIVIKFSPARSYATCGVVGKGPQMSNNVAEYAGVIAILEYLDAENTPDEETVIYGDSQLVVRQLMGEWRVKGGLYLPYYNRACKLLQKRRKVRFQWIPREENAECDQLSRTAGR